VHIFPTRRAPPLPPSLSLRAGLTSKPSKHHQQGGSTCKLARAVPPPTKDSEISEIETNNAFAQTSSDPVERLKRELRAALPTWAREHLFFTRLVDAHAHVLYAPEVLKLAVARYQILWLPLCRFHLEGPTAGEPLTDPPLDIAFVWHCHVLCPLQCAPVSLFECLVAACALVRCTRSAPVTLRAPQSSAVIIVTRSLRLP
jgi:hypothetical protein